MSFNALVVEDEVDLQDIIFSVFMDDFNAEVFSASSGNEAVEKLKSGIVIDRIVSDYSVTKPFIMELLAEITKALVLKKNLVIS